MGWRKEVVLYNIDEFVKSQKAPVIVIPANAGIQENQLLMDSRVRGNDGLGGLLRARQYLSLIPFIRCSTLDVRCWTFISQKKVHP